MIEPGSYTTLILGVGNPLLSDEGVGIRVVERLAELYDLPEEVQTLDGGTLGMDLLYYLEGVENLLLVDAVQAGLQPGELVRMNGDDVPAYLGIKISPHQVGIPDMLFAARLKGIYPAHVILWGVQPATLEISLELSPTLAPLVDVLVGKVVKELDLWGHTLRPRAVPGT